MLGIPESQSRKESNWGKSSQHLCLSFSPSLGDMAQNQNYYNLISCRLHLPYPFWKQICWNVKCKILKLSEDLSVPWFLKHFQVNQMQINRPEEGKGLPTPAVSNTPCRFTRKPRTQLSFAEVPGCQAQSPEKADLARNPGISCTWSNSSKGQPSTKWPCLPRNLPHSAELGTTHVSERWGIQSQNTVGWAPQLHRLLQSFWRKWKCWQGTELQAKVMRNEQGILWALEWMYPSEEPRPPRKSPAPGIPEAEMQTPGDGRSFPKQPWLPA